MSRAFAAQSKIGWDQFLRGRIATHWKDVIHLYYKDRRPGAQFTPDQWMRTTIDALWTFALTLWRQRNHKLHGHNGELSNEAKRQKSLIRATAVYNDTIDEDESRILHRTPVANMINWTKQHLDAYLATAEMACEWNVEPG